MRSTTFILALALLGALALFGCSPYSPELGNAPYYCAMGEPFCPEGYFCQTVAGAPAGKDRVCVSEGGLMPDANQIGFPCKDDSALEGSARNDTPMTAYQTPVDSQFQMVMLADLAICPMGDKDHYAVTLSAASANMAVEVIVSWDSGQPLSMSLLNAGGTAIVNGTANGDKSLRACAPNLPAATYHAAVFATGSTQNNYRLSIKILPNCAI